MMKRIDEIASKNPFKVPENYFEEANRKIISATTESGTCTMKPRLFVRLRPYLAAAASVAVLALLSYVTVKVFLPVNRTELVPEISLQEFSDSYLNDIDILTLEENAAPMLFSEEIPDVERSEIIDYLLLENIDINEIYELL
jgi:hypothetical protein